MYWGRLVKIDTALYPISTQHNLAVASENISMLLNPGFYSRVSSQIQICERFGEFASQNFPANLLTNSLIHHLRVI